MEIMTDKESKNRERRDRQRERVSYFNKASKI